MSEDDEELYAVRSRRFEEKNKKKMDKVVVEEGAQEEMEIPTFEEETLENSDQEEYHYDYEEEQQDAWNQHEVVPRGVDEAQLGMAWGTEMDTNRDEVEDDSSDGMQSVYNDSDEYDSPTIDSEDEELLRNLPFFPIFNPSLDPFKYVPQLGTKFKNPTQLKDALRYYAVENKFGIRFERSKKKLVVAKCKPKCNWRIYASWMSTENSFQIKSFKEKHRCSKSYNIAIANSKWIAKVFHNKITNNPKLKWKELKEEVRDKYGLEVSEKQCGKAKMFALGEVDSVMREHYSKLWDYGAEVKASIPNSTVKIMVDRPSLDSPGHFQRIYICLGPLKKCWREGCRPVIGVDGCFLKTYCKGELLTAIGRDGNNWMFPIAWAVVEGETKDAWLWFLRQLSDDLFLGDGRGFTMISDQQKGLESAIEDILPNIEHRMCARHVYANFRGRFSGGHLKNLFWQAAKCGTEQEFEAYMKQIEVVCPEAKEYLTKKKNPSQWCRAWFGTHSACDSVENNMCETFNGVIVEARALKIIDMLEEIKRYMTKRLHTKAREIETWDGEVCPRIMKKLEKIEENCKSWRVYLCGGGLFEVKSGRIQYKVDLASRICSCRQWDVSGLPCVHALTAILENREDKEDYVAAWFKKDKISKAYGEFLKPLNGENLWPKTGFLPFLPPKDRRMPGRPKKARRKSRHESPQKGKGRQNPNIIVHEKAKRVSRAGRQNQCGNCKELGHNRKSCKNPPKVATMGSQSSAVVDNLHSQFANLHSQSSSVNTVPSSASMPPLPISPLPVQANVGLPPTLNNPPMGNPHNGRAKGSSKAPAKGSSKAPAKCPAKGPPMEMTQGPNPKRQQPPKGIGLYICPQTNDTYYRGSTSKRGKWFTTPGPKHQAFIPHKSNTTTRQPPQPCKNSAPPPPRWFNAPPRWSRAPPTRTFTGKSAQEMQHKDPQPPPQKMQATPPPLMESQGSAASSARTFIWD
ncbi:hypothetical protein ACHQM5_007645 [Ranunculus cassubicifolius]